MNDFSHLKKWENAIENVPKAREAVQVLRKQTKGYFEELEEQELREKRRKRREEALAEKEAYSSNLEKLRGNFVELSMMKDSQKRGIAFERYLNQLFRFFELDPKGSFNISQEQIDGLFTFDNTEYLLEAKWHKKPLSLTNSAYAFATKIGGKSKLAMGLLVSINGFNEFENVNTDQLKCMLLMDGEDLYYVVDGKITLTELLYRKRRGLAESGQIFLKARDLI